MRINMAAGKLVDRRTRLRGGLAGFVGSIARIECANTYVGGGHDLAAVTRVFGRVFTDVNSVRASERRAPSPPVARRRRIVLLRPNRARCILSFSIRIAFRERARNREPIAASSPRVTTQQGYVCGGYAAECSGSRYGDPLREEKKEERRGECYVRDVSRLALVLGRTRDEEIRAFPRRCHPGRPVARRRRGEEPEMWVTYPLFVPWPFGASLAGLFALVTTSGAWNALRVQGISVASGWNAVWMFRAMRFGTFCLKLLRFIATSVVF